MEGWGDGKKGKKSKLSMGEEENGLGEEDKDP